MRVVKSLSRHNPERYGVLALSWTDVRATYSRMAKMIVLESPRLVRPLAVMNFGGRALTPEFIAAKAIVKRTVGERWSERWLLP